MVQEHLCDSFVGTFRIRKPYSIPLLVETKIDCRIQSKKKTNSNSWKTLRQIVRDKYRNGCGDRTCVMNPLMRSSKILGMQSDARAVLLGFCGVCPSYTTPCWLAYSFSSLGDLEIIFTFISILHFRKEKQEMRPQIKSLLHDPKFSVDA